MKHTDDERKMNKESKRIDYELYVLLGALVITLFLATGVCRATICLIGGC